VRVSVTTIPRLSDPVPEFRTAMAERVVKWFYTPISVFIVLLAIVAFGDGQSPVGLVVRLLLGSFMLLMATGLLWVAWVRGPKLGVIADADGIRVQTWLRTQRFAWPELSGFTVDQGVVFVLCANGSRFMAPGLGTTRFARSGRTFEMAEELNALLASRTSLSRS
jgi:hypothetical protein